MEELVVSSCPSSGIFPYAFQVFCQTASVLSSCRAILAEVHGSGHIGVEGRDPKGHPDVTCDAGGEEIQGDVTNTGDL